MLSYPISEAETLLGSKLSSAQQSLDNCQEDLDFLREQITVRCSLAFEGRVEGVAVGQEDHTDDVQTMEVATARVYNWDVQQRRKERVEAGDEESGGKVAGPDG